MKIETHSKYFDLYDIEPLCLALVGLLAKKRQGGVVVSETDPVYNFTGVYAGMATRSYSFHFEEVFNEDDLKKVRQSGRFESIIEQFERELEKAEKGKKE